MSTIYLAKEHLEKLLKPINRLTESCVLNLQKNKLYSVSSSPDNTVILYAEAKIPSLDNLNDNDKIRLNLISIKKLLSGLECLSNGDNFSLEVDKNNIKCQSIDQSTQEAMYFKYHLVDDDVVKETPVNINKIASLKFDTEFSVSEASIKQIMLGYSFASDVTKIYFSTQNGRVIAEIDDKTQQNVDNIKIPISSKFIGNELEPTPINMEVFKNLVSCKSEIKVRINTQYKVFIFQNLEGENVDLKYIVSALIK